MIHKSIQRPLQASRKSIKSCACSVVLLLNRFFIFQLAVRSLQRDIEEAESNQSDLQEKIEEIKSSAYVVQFRKKKKLVLTANFMHTWQT